MSTIDGVLVEDHAAFRQALAFLFDRDPAFRVVGQAGTLAEARALLDGLGAGAAVAVVDLNLPDGSGAEFVGDLRGRDPEAVVVVLTASMDPEETGRAARAGAAEVLRKSAGIVEIVEAVRRLTSTEGAAGP